MRNGGQRRRLVEAAGVADEPRDTIRVSAAAVCSRSTADQEPYLRPATRQIHSVSVHILELKGEDAAALVERRMESGMRGTVFESEMTVSGGLRSGSLRSATSSKRTCSVKVRAACLNPDPARRAGSMNDTSAPLPRLARRTASLVDGIERLVPSFDGSDDCVGVPGPGKRL